MRYKRRVLRLIERIRNRVSVMEKGVNGNKLSKEDALQIIKELDNAMGSVEELVELETDDTLHNEANLL